jgi:hypothetical protein
MGQMETIVASVKKRDHKMVRVPIGEEMSDAVIDEMEAAGYVFACAPAAPNGQGFREFYFERAR